MRFTTRQYIWNHATFPALRAQGWPPMEVIRCRDPKGCLFHPEAMWPAFFHFRRVR